MTAPRVYADFNNADAQGRLRLTCNGTLRDLAQQKIELKAGLVLTLYSDDATPDGESDDLEASGVVEYSTDDRCWVARIDWSAVRHASDVRFPPISGVGGFDITAPRPETAP